MNYINEQFLMWIITHLCDIEYPFWEFGFRDKGSKKYPDYIIEEEMKKFEDKIHFQVSSKVCGGMLLCATYGTIDENNKLEVTHNC